MNSETIATKYTQEKLPLTSDIVFKRVFSRDGSESILKDLLEAVLEILKFIEKDSGANTKLEQWLWLIAGREDKLEMAKKENKEIKKAMEIIDEMSMDEKEWELFESRRLAIMDYNTGIYLAKEEGKEERNKRTG